MELFKQNKFDPEAFEREQAKRREELVKIPAIAKLIKDKNIPIDKVNQLSYFDDYLKSEELCKSCKGLHACRQEIKGLRLSLNYEYTLFPVKEYCEYYLKREENDAFMQNIIYSDIPFEIKYLFLENVDVDKDNVDHLKLWATFTKILKHEINHGYYVYGEFGTGKTYLAVALANSLAKNGEKVAFVKMSSFVNKMRQQVINDRDNFDDILEALKRVKYLIIDDLGTESLTSFIRDDVLFNLLDYRMENKLLTIFTSNHSFKSLGASLAYDKNNNKDSLKAERLMERIKVLATEYHLGGKDRRFL